MHKQALHSLSTLLATLSSGWWLHLPAHTHRRHFSKPLFHCILRDVMFFLQGSGHWSFLYVICVITCDAILHICHAAGEAMDVEDSREVTQAAELLQYKWSQMKSGEHDGALHKHCKDCWEMSACIPAGVLHDYIMLQHGLCFNSELLSNHYSPNFYYGWRLLCPTNLNIA